LQFGERSDQINRQDITPFNNKTANNNPACALSTGGWPQEVGGKPITLSPARALLARTARFYGKALLEHKVALIEYHKIFL
jgi:hypothetical protein